MKVLGVRAVLAKVCNDLVQRTAISALYNFYDSSDFGNWLLEFLRVNGIRAPESLQSFRVSKQH
jgi:hypothetical protein